MEHKVVMDAEDGCAPSDDWVLVGKESKDGSQNEQGTADFLLRMGNELRRELNMLSTHSRTALDTGITPYQKQTVRRLNRSAGQLQSMLDDITLFHRIETHRMAPASAQFFLSEVVVAAMAELMPQAGEKGLDFTYEVGSAVPNHVISDRNYLLQILIKVLRSVTEFAHYGKINVSVSTLREQEGSAPNCRVIIKFAISYAEHHPIRSNGQDPMRDIDSLLSRFTDMPCEEHELSLFIVRRLVALMDGDIWTEGGLGPTTLHVSLPFEVDDKKDSTQIQWILDKTPRSKKVLLLDQGSEHFRDTVIHHFETSYRKCCIVKIDCGDDVLLAKLQDADCGDCACAVVENTEIATKLRECEQWMNIPVLVVGPKISVDLSSLTEDVKVISTETAPSLRILIAEDRIVYQKVISKMLGKARHTSQIANNGLEAFEQAKEEKFDLILMDQVMPVMAGWEAASKIRKWESENDIRRTPIIGLFHHGASVAHGSFEHVDDWVTKPLAYRALMACIRRNAGRYL